MERAELIRIVEATGCAVSRGSLQLLVDPASRAHEAALRGLGEVRGEAGPGWLGIPTGGTSGAVRFARHDEQTLGAAAVAFGRHFGLARVNAVDVLPAFHVSGLMSRVRAAVTGGTHLAWSWARLAAGELPTIGSDDWVISLVPTQLQRLLRQADARAWLSRFRVVLLGGAPAWPALLDSAAEAGLPVALSYGMTETAAMVAAQRPEEFSAGARDCGSALPHATITLADDATIVIEASSVFRGYLPQLMEDRRFVTEDRGALDAAGRLTVLGRKDATIISGGKKIHPEDVERALRSTGLFEDVAVIGVPDEEWGEAVVACYPRQAVAPDLASARDHCARVLDGHLRPKRYVEVATWPRSEHGKLNRAQLKAIVATA